MDTDPIFYELFRDRPEWLRELTGIPFPENCKGTSEVLKHLEVRCDLLLKSPNRGEPYYIIEFQLYHDHSIFNRTELARQVLWKHLNKRKDCRKREFCPQEVEIVILFGSEAELPNSFERYSNMRNLFIDELLEKLAIKNPESALLAALAPLYDSLSELELQASSHYDKINEAQDLEQQDRELLSEIFLNLLLQRFKNKSRTEIRAMIAKLTPIKETVVGQELLQEGREEGRDQGKEEVAVKMIKAGKSNEEITEFTSLSTASIEKLRKGL